MLDEEMFDAEGPVAIERDDGPSVVVLPRRVPAWPDGHTPANACERALWESFEDLRIDPTSKLTQQIVALRIGRSRTSLSSDTVGYRLLRKAIQDEIGRRKALRGGASASKKKPRKTKEEREAEKAARRETSIKYFQDIAQRADAAVITASVRAVRAEAERDGLKARLKAIFDDFKAGLWKRADGSEDGVGELGAFLSLPGYALVARDDGVSPPPGADAKAGRARQAWRDGRSTWRTKSG
ncbi:hypothetical protein EJC47_11025 [Sphingomonas sp. TF3]|uniref:hypothetical protein n=1 Tax=Sphingomonas sp. TF3 TaxID=2495580 RepID=UPI000F8845E2|nr:hypothetical protein [Sphingomonas sp. TF3]RUN76496.1 hypothetical protein EJC47_11025 [Sphingomonas sp. TF3]